MPEQYAIILVSQLEAHPYSWPVAEEGSFEKLARFTTLNLLLKNRYSKELYLATLCDLNKDSRKYRIVNQSGSSRIEWGAIYKLSKKLL